jgi:copper(I)-binding protein
MLFTVLLFLLSLTAASAQDQMPGAEAIIISGAWARPTAMEAMAMPEATPEAGMAHGGGMSHGGMAGGGVTGAYLSIENAGEVALRLVSASSPVAMMTEIHETTVVDNVAQMNPVEGGLVINPGEAVALQPGSLHIMLMDLTTELLPDTAIPLTLTFEAVTEAATDAAEPIEIVTAALVQMEPPGASSVVVQGAWARPTVAAMAGMSEATPEAGMGHGGMSMSDVSAVYMTLLNRGDAADRLVSASTPAAGLVEIHESRMVDNVMQMNPLPDGLALPVGERVRLEPGGLHIMLMELTGPLAPDTAIPLTLTFESGAVVTIAVPVYDALMAAMS